MVSLDNQHLSSAGWLFIFVFKVIILFDWLGSAHTSIFRHGSAPSLCNIVWNWRPSSPLRSNRRVIKLSLGAWAFCWMLYKIVSVPLEVFLILLVSPAERHLKHAEVHHCLPSSLWNIQWSFSIMFFFYQSSGCGWAGCVVTAGLLVWIPSDTVHSSNCPQAEVAPGALNGSSCPLVYDVLCVMLRKTWNVVCPHTTYSFYI